MAETIDARAAADERRAEKVGEHWATYAREGEGRRTDERLEWNQWTPVREAIDQRISGSGSRNVVGHLADCLRQPVPRVLSLGCGSGSLDRDLLEQGVCEEVVGVDISQGALDTARRLAGDLPISYVRLDMESEPLPRRFPVAFCMTTLHHINDLGSFLANVHASLDEEGLFALYEYVGPSRFQWTPRQIRLAGDIYSLLPPRYRFNHLPRLTEYELRRPDISGMIGVDPSEAVRSGEMMQVVERYFERLERREVGGGVLFPLLTGIVANFDEEDALDREFIDLAMRLDEALTGAGVMPSCFNFELYRRRPEPPGGTREERLEAERAGLVRRQEERIVELNRELEEAEEVNRPLVEEFARLQRENLALSLAVEESLEANAALKDDRWFRALRWVSGLVRRGDGPRVTVPAARPRGVIGTDTRLPMPVSVEDRPRSALVRAVERYARESARGSVLLWALWLEASFGRSDSALLLGVEPGTAWACVESGACGRAALGRVERAGDIVIEWPSEDGGAGPFDVVVWTPRPGEPAGAALSIEGLLAEGGRLVRLSVPPGDGGSTVPRGFVLTEEAWLTARPNVHAVEAHHRDSDPRMAQAVAALGLYVECVLAGCGLGGPGLHVEVFERGEPRAGASRDPAAVDDIAVLQEMELGRLERRLAESYEAREHLRKLCADASAAVAANESTIDYLERERSILKSRGPWKYPWWVAFRLRERKGGR
ncbi:MAG: class I SAM-dependent methyltransferase [Actinobacteria bacterium]|nr:class I SAM-dependent methyltransferase [Actinomycetota bacterium]MBU1942432.1 class I SAM-dependent methyltransferase [Actinomycetota bacterium]MBU2686304.1 class I SAM-dependent methyltransferase [Actinomycetota bacterium]